MTEIVNELAQVSLPPELLEELNIPELVQGFKRSFDELDAFKQVRDSHGKRAIGKKFLDLITRDNTLENAQLDAIEVQARFSKAIGQLIAISIAQSQYLEKQQGQLSEQQLKLKEQASRIENHTAIIESQHHDLAQQNIELKELINNYFELRGLTQEGAKKLIAIASEVKETSDQLHQYVDMSLSGALQKIESVEELAKAELSKTVESIKLIILDAQAEMETSLSLQNNNIFLALGKVDDSLTRTLKKVSDSEVRTSAELDETIAVVGSKTKDLQIQIDVGLCKQIDKVALIETSLKNVESNNADHYENINLSISSLELKNETAVMQVSQLLAAYQTTTQRKIKLLSILLGSCVLVLIGLLVLAVFK